MTQMCRRTNEAIYAERNEGGVVRNDEVKL